VAELNRLQALVYTWFDVYDPQGVALSPGTRSFWIAATLSSIAIINLIANLPFLYHKPGKYAVTRLDRS
jgi:hypothetical protein